MAKDITEQPNAGETALQYAQDVLSGKLIAGRYVKLACQRFLDDLQFGQSRGIYFDSSSAQHAVDFFGFLRHVKGDLAKSAETAGFLLAPWQCFIIANLFGWKNLATGFRRFKETHIEIAKKNGKSTMMAGIGLYMLFADGEPGSEVYSAACTKEQAKIIFEVASQMVVKSPFLKARIGVWRNNLHVVSTGSKFEPLAADKGPLDGKHIHCGLIDELHEHPNRDVYDVIARGTIQRSQPLLLSITTAGVDQLSICYLQREYGVKVLQGILPADSFFAYIACADDDDNWLDDSVLYKANPNLGIPGGLVLERLQEARGKAAGIPAELNEFLRKHLNIWTNSQDAWLEAGAWEKNCATGNTVSAIELREQAIIRMKGIPLVVKDPKGVETITYPMPRRCFGGLDLAECEDMVAFTLLFPPCDRVVASELDVKTKKLVERVTQEEDLKWSILTWFWIPEMFVEERARKNRAPYDVWIKAKFLEKTPGNTVAQEAIRNKILELYHFFRMGEVGYDKFGAEQWLAPKLLADGVKMVQIPQRFEHLDIPTKTLTSLIHVASAKDPKDPTKLATPLVEHFNNPILRWMASNVQLLTDSNGNRRPDKGKSRNKIDGIVATVMAVNRALANPSAGKDDPNRFRVRMI